MKQTVPVQIQNSSVMPVRWWLARLGKKGQKEDGQENILVCKVDRYSHKINSSMVLYKIQRH